MLAQGNHELDGKKVSTSVYLNLSLKYTVFVSSSVRWKLRTSKIFKAAQMHAQVINLIHYEIKKKIYI